MRDPPLRPGAYRADFQLWRAGAATTATAATTAATAAAAAVYRDQRPCDALGRGRCGVISGQRHGLDGPEREWK